MEKLLKELNSRTLYNLHTRPNAKYVHGTGEKQQSNKFYISVQGDFGGGITEKDCEEYADEIFTAVNSYDELKQQNESLRKDIEGLQEENKRLLEEIQNWKDELKDVREDFKEYRQEHRGGYNYDY